jgi:hypothetical protein
MQSKQTLYDHQGQPVSAGTAISGVGAALLTVLFFAPWLTACNVEVSGIDLALQQSPQGQSGAVLLLGIPLAGLAGAVLAFKNINQSPETVQARAKVVLGLAVYPLLCLALVYLSLKGPQQQGLLDVRPMIQLKFGYWGSVLAALAMIGGAALDMAGSRMQAARYPPRRTLPDWPPPPAAPPPRPLPVKAMQAALIGRNGEWANRRLSIDGDSLAIGRHPDCDLRLTDTAVSRRHAVIRCGQGRYFLQDQNSSTGCYVNGRQVSACELKNGDTIRIGNAEFQFQLKEGGAWQTLPGEF